MYPNREDSESYPLKFAINERSRLHVYQRRTDTETC